MSDPRVDALRLRAAELAQQAYDEGLVTTLANAARLADLVAVGMAQAVDDVLAARQERGVLGARFDQALRRFRTREGLS